MPYPAHHKQQTRERILKSARHLFNKKGFAEVTIDEIMAAAELTRGVFYRYFKTKDELYSDALMQFACKSAPERWQRKHVDPCAEGATLARMIMEAYLSRDHFVDRGGSCPTVGLASDVSRSSIKVKRAFRQVVEMMLDVFTVNLEGDDKSARALALVSVCVGAMVLARAVDDADLAGAFLKAARGHVLTSAGWTDR